MSRLVVRRSVAKDMCDSGKVLVGGARAKASRELRVGDQVTVKLKRRIVTVEVVEVPKGNVPKARAVELYRVISDTAVPDPDFEFG